MKRGWWWSSVVCGLMMNNTASAVSYFWSGANGNWSNPILWSPAGGPPNQGDEAVIEGKNNIVANVSLSANVLGVASPDHIFLGEDARLDTTGFRLNVNGPVYTSGSGTLDVKPVTGNPALIGLDAETIGVEAGSQVRILNGYLRTADFNLNTGTLWFDGGGTVQATDHTFIGNGSGSGDAKLNVINNGAAVLLGTTTFNKDADVSVPNGSSLTLSNQATFLGGKYTGGGLIRFDGATTAVNNNTTFDMSSGRVDLDGDEGALAAGQTVSVNANLELNVQSIDTADNQFGRKRLVGEDRLIINNFGKLTVNLTNPNAAWTMAGHLIINAPQGQLQAGNLSGSDMTLTGVADIEGNSGWSARTDITGVVNVAANSSLALYGGTIGIPNQLLGGTIQGEGRLVNLTGHALMGHGTIDTDIEFLANSELRASNGTLVLGPNANIVAVSKIGTRNQDGILDVHHAWNTNSAAESLELKGGQVIGGDIVNDGTTRGNGRIGSSAFINQGQVIPEGGELVIDTASNPDLDGASLLNNGFLDVTNGNLRVTKPLNDAYNSSMTVGAGRTAHFEKGWTLGTGLLPFSKGSLHLNGGNSPAARATIAGGKQTLEGVVNVSGEGAFEAPTAFASSVNVNMPDENTRLRLFQSATIETGASFGGKGHLVVTSSSSLKLGTSLVGVTVENAGTLDVGNSVGDATIQDVMTTGLSRIQLNLDGTSADLYDRLNVVNRIDLDGTLVVEVNQLGGTYTDPTTPGTYDKFELIDAVTVAGDFDSFRYAGQLLTPIASDKDHYHVGNGLFRILHNDRSSVTLTNYRALMGDSNGDGVFDSEDLVEVFQVGEYEDGIANNSDWVEGDWNGDQEFDSTDFVEAFQSGGYNAIGLIKPRDPVAAIAAVPEPGSMGLVVSALISLGCLRRRR